MLKINKLKMALMNQAQTVMGRRGRVIPFARKSMVVTLKLRAFASPAAQKRAMLAIQTVMPTWGARKKGVVIPSRDATVTQNASKLMLGKAMSLAPIWIGRRQLPNPAACGARGQ